MLTTAQIDWLMDNLASPVAPVEWFKRLKLGAGPVGWLLEIVKWLAVALWAVFFVWLWFFLFVILFLWDYFGPKADQPPSASAEQS